MLSRTFKNSFLALFIAVSAMFLLGNGFTQELKASVLEIVNKFVDAKPIIKPDLAIDKITLTKLDEPTETFHYYKYSAMLVVENKGETLMDAKVKLSAGPGQQHLFLKNSNAGFSLEHGKKYILDKYEVIFDSNYNVGDLKFSIELTDREDNDLENNEKWVQVTEFPAAIKNISLESVKDSGEYFVQFDGNNEFYDHKVEIYVGNYDAGGDYFETRGDEGIYSYEKLPIDERAINSKTFEKVDTDEVGSYEVNLGIPIAEKDEPDFLYVKITNPSTGYYAVSDLLKLPKKVELTRADFAKYFIELTGEKVDNSEVSGFSDVNGMEWYAPYAQSIYNLGLLNFDMKEFEAEKFVTREQAVKILMDYYDADLATTKSDLQISDVDEKDELHHYLSSFNRADKFVIAGKFEPSANASLDFLKYLIYANK